MCCVVTFLGVTRDKTVRISGTGVVDRRSFVLATKSEVAPPTVLYSERVMGGVISRISLRLDIFSSHRIVSSRRPESFAAA